VDDDGTDEPDAPDAPAFFLSYARAKRPLRPIGLPTDYNDPVKRFFQDLSVRVNHMIRLPVGLDAGFMDVGLEAGVEWSPELLRQVGSCTVFVALLSEPYLYDSRWCPMEWHLFAQRTVRRRPDRPFVSPHQSAMIPVIWTPLDRRLPPAVSPRQLFAPADLPDEYLGRYQTDGLLGAADVDPHAYKAVVFKIARQIQLIRSSYVVEPVEREDTKGLPDSFWGGTP